MMQETKTVAVVGYGYWGKKLAAACSAAGLTVVIVDPAVSADIPEIPYPQLSWQAVLSDQKVFGVIIATPEKTHAALTLAAVQANKAVLVEKPAATTVKDWQICVELAARNNLPLLVDYTFLHSRALKEWKKLTRNYAAQLGPLKQITSRRKSQLTPERIAGKALPIWWDVVIHDLYLLRDVYAAVPHDWQITQPGLPNHLFTQAKFAAAQFIAAYSWDAPPERSWTAEYERGSLLWQRTSGGELFEVTINQKKRVSYVIADQEPSPLDVLIQEWQRLWGKKNNLEKQKKHWLAVEQDIAELSKIDMQLTQQTPIHRQDQ